MKIEGLKGEFYFKALLCGRLTMGYYKSKADAADANDVMIDKIEWPLEVLDDASIRVIEESEYV